MTATTTVNRTRGNPGRSRATAGLRCQLDDDHGHQAASSDRRMPNISRDYFSLKPSKGTAVRPTRRFQPVSNAVSIPPGAVVVYSRGSSVVVLASSTGLAWSIAVSYT